MDRASIKLSKKYWYLNIRGEPVRRMATGFYGSGVLFKGVKRVYSDVYRTQEEAVRNKDSFDIRNYHNVNIPENIKTD